jgi:hypothetical protein
MEVANKNSQKEWSKRHMEILIDEIIIRKVIGFLHCCPNQI